MTIQEFRDYMASGKPVVGGVPAKVIKRIEVKLFIWQKKYDFTDRKENFFLCHIINFAKLEFICYSPIPFS